MTVKTKITMTMGIALIAMATAFTSCKKEEDAHTPPNLSFDTSAGYTFADDSVSTGDTVLVGVIADKTEDELKTFNVSSSVNGGASTTLTNYTLTAAEENHFEADYSIVVGANPAETKEKFDFTITDRDGNITTKSITLIMK